MIGKKLIKILVVTLVAIAAIEVSAVLANNFFFEKVSVKEALKRSLPATHGNAIKHAYASSLVYSTFRTIFLPENLAEEITIALGKTNEIAEIIFKPHQDSTLEMLKDLENNLLGICAAKIIEENSENPAIQDRIAFIGNLAERKKLILTRDDVVIKYDQKELIRKTSNYSEAVKLFTENRDKISCNFDFSGTENEEEINQDNIVQD